MIRCIIKLFTSKEHLARQLKDLHESFHNHICSLANRDADKAYALSDNGFYTGYDQCLTLLNKAPTTAYGTYQSCCNEANDLLWWLKKENFFPAKDIKNATIIFKSIRRKTNLLPEFTHVSS